MPPPRFPLRGSTFGQPDGSNLCGRSVRTVLPRTTGMHVLLVSCLTWIRRRELCLAMAVVGQGRSLMEMWVNRCPSHSGWLRRPRSRSCSRDAMWLAQTSWVSCTRPSPPGKSQPTPISRSPWCRSSPFWLTCGNNNTIRSGCGNQGDLGMGDLRGAAHPC